MESSGIPIGEAWREALAHWAEKVGMPDSPVGRSFFIFGAAWVLDALSGDIDHETWEKIDAAMMQFMTDTEAKFWGVRH
jgi:hypothetical protein